MDARRTVSKVVLGVWLAAAPAGLAPPTAAAEGDDVAGSGLGQGEANINVRADIKLGIQGARATPADRVEQLSDAVAKQMTDMRKCYYDLVEKRATAVGSIAMRITLEAGGARPQIETKETGTSDPKLTECIQKAVGRAVFAKVQRPAAAIVTLEFDNTRAKGQAAMERTAAEADRIDVAEGADGSFQASWKSTDGKVAFGVSSPKSKAAVEVVLKTLRDGYAGFTDCRRRSEKDGKSPAGELEVQLQLQRGGKAAAKVQSSTVAHERAVPCVERVFKRIDFEGAPGGQRADVHITFSP